MAETFYDAPENIVSMLLDGEFTARGAANAAFSPSRLSPAERDGIRERLTKAAGDSPITRAVVDVATDPWVWFFLLTTPVGYGASGGLLKSMFNVGKSVSPYMANGEAGLAAVMGALTAGQVVNGTAIHSAAMQFEDSMRKMRFASSPELNYGDNIVRVAKHMDVSGEGMLDPRRYRPGSLQHEKVMQMNAAVHAELAQLHKDTVDLTLRVGKDKKPSIIGKDLPAIIDESRMREVLDTFSAADVAPNARTLMRENRDHVFRDPDAFARLVRGMAEDGNARNGKNGNWTTPVKKVFEAAGWDPKVIDEYFQAHEKVLNHNEPHYVPRTTHETWEHGRMVPPDEAAGYEVFSAMVEPARSAKGRKPAMPLYHPDDYATWDKMFGLTEEGRKQWTKAETILRSGEKYKFLRPNVAGAVQQHTSSMRRTRAMFIDPISDELRAVNKVTRKNMKPDNPATYFKEGRVVDSIDDLEAKGHAPPGGFSLADVFAGERQAARDNPYLVRTVDHVILPYAMGSVHPKFMLAAATNTMARRMAGAFADSAVGKYIHSNGGEYGKRFITELDGYSKYADDVHAGSTLVHATTRALYAGALGLNVASALVNATQPWLLAGSVIGYRHLLGAYADTFKEFGEYFKRREQISPGLGAISVNERDSLVKKSFKWAPEAQLSGSLFENIERVSLSGDEARSIRPSFAKRLYMELPLKLFEKVEVLNRNVVAHAMERRLLSEGTDPRSPLARAAVRTMISETQFGSHWMNTPIAMMEGVQGMSPLGGVLGNPLMRQFLQFPTRSATSALHFGTRLDGGEGFLSLSGQKQFWKQTARAMGISALGVYLARDMFGADLERAGYAASTTDILPFVRQGRFDAKESVVPLPPVLSLLSEGVNALTDEDKSFFATVLPRVVPGGIAIQRLLENAAGNIHVPVQRRYVGWSEGVPDENGVTMVPVYDRTKGLVAYQPATLLIMRAAGVDLGSYDAVARTEKMYRDNADEIRTYKNQALTALMTGDHDHFQSVASEFQTRFGTPLLIDRRNLDRELQQWTQPRVQRTYGLIPNTYKPLYETPELPAGEMDRKARAGEIVQQAKEAGDQNYAQFEGFGGF